MRDWRRGRARAGSRGRAIKTVLARRRCRLSLHQPVTYKALAWKHGLHVDAAKAALAAFVEGAPADVAATYLLSGWTPPADDAPAAHVVRLVPGASLAAARAALAPVTGCHVFAVAPAASARSAAALWAADADAETAAFDVVLAGGANPLGTGASSAVECPAATRAAPAPVPKEEPAPASAPMPPRGPRAPPPAAKRGGVAAAMAKAGASKKAKPAPAAKKPAPPALAGSDSDGPVRRRGKAVLDSSDDEGGAPAAEPDFGGGSPTPSPAGKRPAPAPAGGAKKRRVKCYINAAGEEVTETVEEEEEEVKEEAAAAPAPSPPKPSPAKAKPKAAAKPVSKKVSAAKGTKGIASFFGKKK